MKAIIVEGQFDCALLQFLFPQIEQRNIVLYTAHGFSNVFAVSKTFLDHGYDVLAVLDTESHKPGNNNRIVVERILSNNLIRRNLHIVWMDPFIEKVIDRAIPGFWHGNLPHHHTLMQFLERNRTALLHLDEFQKIASFIEG